jgi:hypothetical protein
MRTTMVLLGISLLVNAAVWGWPWLVQRRQPEPPQHPSRWRPPLMASRRTHAVLAVGSLMVGVLALTSAWIDR